MKVISNTILSFKLQFIVIITCIIIYTMVWGIDVNAGKFSHSVSFDVSSLNQEKTIAPDGKAYTVLNWSGMSSCDKVGSPDLPVQYIKFLLPTYCNNISITINSVKIGEIRKCDYIPYPVQGEIVINDFSDSKFVVPIEEEYLSASVDYRVNIVEEYFIDGFNHIITLAVHPISYAGRTNELTIYEKIDFSVNYDICRADEMDITPIVPKRKTAYFSLDSSIIDPASVRNNLCEAVYKNDYISTEEYYYIIVPDYLKSAVTEFAIWKRCKGYNVIVKTIEEILDSEKYKINSSKSIGNNKLVDAAASLRAFLTDEYAEKGFFYCLLVGNSRTKMPIRKAINISNSKELPYEMDDMEGVVPTDNYFSDLLYKWNLSVHPGHSIYTDVLPTSYNPCISIGRLLCSSKKEIENWFRKVKLYEANPGYGDNEYLNDALFIEQWSWDFESKRPNSLVGDSKNIRNYLRNYLNCDSIVDPHVGAYAEDSNNKWGVKGAEAISRISKVGLSSWHGHGSPPGWACSFGTRYITSEDSVFNSIYRITKMIKDEKGNGLDNMINVDSPSVAYSISCDNTPFDNLRRNSGELWNCNYNLGEAFTVGSKGGGPVFLGNTRVGYIGSSASMELLFFKGIVKNRKIGYAENYSKENYRSSHIRATHSVIGDSEISLWLGRPKNLSYSFGSSKGTINFNGIDMSDAKIGFYDGDENAISYNVASPNLIITEEMLPATFDKDAYMISVWKPDYLPIMLLVGQNASLIGKTKKFIVREAYFGNKAVSNWNVGDYSVRRGANLFVSAIDLIKADSGFIVDAGGRVTFECDKSIVIGGASVKNGGTFNVKGNDVTLNGGFVVELGGSISIETNR